ncbi:TIGR04211 family SH3 domain-containing protein [Thiohalophilus thiocyanatoxydans]|uniref:SH3 domain protein n=1 Tax=Thiohalophilus thiocyanatoxydans TaxID=381308 RepID=A0A4R8IR51_9GAMM|nr:TIGR04211 family SH3 domain-containing protein [Thiohalophilus thiocyanatoxydans]TDX99602.1 SH3 domain protein [Thiohalophilus thiocyanatoxydans]
MYYRPLIFLICLVGPLNGALHADEDADTIYISDQLRVGVRPEPDSRSTPVGVVTTGMQLEVLDSRNGYLQIRTDKDLTGWIKEIYTAEEPPAMVQLERLETKRAENLEELEALRQNQTALEEANERLNNQLDQVKAERAKLQLRLARDAFGQKQQGSYGLLWLTGLVVSAVAAFAGGVLWQRRQTTRRLGGLRL